MGGIGNNYKNKTLDSQLGSGHSADFPATVYVALFSVACADDTFGTEITGGSYARVAVVNDDTNFPDAVGGQKSNGTVISFPEATADWGTVVGWAVLDSDVGATADNIIFHTTLASSKTVNTGDVGSFPIGTLVVEIP